LSQDWCRLSVLQVELFPLRLPQLAGTRREKREKLQADPRDGLAVELVARAQQLAQSLGIGDRGSVLGLRTDQGVTQGIGRVGRGQPAGDGQTEDSADLRPQALGRLVVPLRLDLPEASQDQGHLGASSFEQRLDAPNSAPNLGVSPWFLSDQPGQRGHRKTLILRGFVDIFGGVRREKWCR